MMKQFALAFTLAMLLAAAPALGLTCTADSTAAIQLNSLKTVTVTCSGFSSETVTVSGTFTQTCLQVSDESYPASITGISSGNPSGTVTFKAISMACQNSVDDRKVTWKFTPSSGTVADAYTTFTISSPLSITAAFTNTSLTATPGSSVTVTLQVSTTASQDINNIEINASGSSSSLGLSDKSISKIAASSGEKIQQVSWTITAPSTTGTYTLNAVVTSQNADSDTASGTLTVSSATTTTTTTSGGGGGGGGGGGTPLVVSETQKIETIAANAIAEAKFLDSRLLVDAIKVQASEEASNVVITVEKRSSAPSTEETAPDTYTAYAYLTISALNLRPEAVTKAEIDFRVNRTWLTENNANADEIILLRLKDGAWARLVTNLLRQDGDYAYYRSEAPGFSVFAIAVEKPVAAPAAVCGNGVCESGETSSCPQDCEAAGKPEIPTEKKEAGVQPITSIIPEIGSYSWIFVIVIAVAVVAMVIELARKKRS